MVGLDGCVAVVTGAGRGLGAAFAIALADVGCAVILCGRSAKALEDTAAAMARTGRQGGEIVGLDLASSESVAAALDTIKARHQRLDVLINNAAMWLAGRPGVYSDGEVTGTINSAVTGTFLLTQGLLPLLMKSQRPDILTIGSTSGLPNAPLGNVSVPFYVAKQAQAAMVRGLHQQLAHTPVRSLIVNPPDLDDVSPAMPEWEASPRRSKGERATNRDVVEAALFALTRPRHVTLSITIDAEEGSAGI